MTFIDSAKIISGELEKHLPRIWDAKSCILEMKQSGNRQWRQMEWIGFYFEFCCQRILHDTLNMPGPKYNKVEFDAFLDIPWDFKVHAMNTSSHQIIVNDSKAISKGIREYGAVGLILALGKVTYNDEARSFQKWHSELKGGKSKYEVERIKRGAWSRLRKTELHLQQISFMQITDSTLVKCGSFQHDFRNSNGSARKPKVLIDLEKMEDETLHFLDFS